jgi:hypothetical protein
MKIMISRFLFWLGQQDWWPFSTLRLWYWALGFIQSEVEEVECFDCKEIVDETLEDFDEHCNGCGVELTPDSRHEDWGICELCYQNN